MILSEDSQTIELTIPEDKLESGKNTLEVWIKDSLGNSSARVKTTITYNT